MQNIEINLDLKNVKVV